MNAILKKSLLIGLPLAALGLAAALFILNNREPSYQGKSLSDWVDDYEDLRWDSPDALAADDALRHIGARAVPFLLKTAPASYQGSPADPDPRPWLHAFEVLGDSAKSATPTLGRWLNDSNRNELAAECLGGMHAIGFPALVNALDSTNAALRGAVVISLLDHYPWYDNTNYYGEAFDPESVAVVQRSGERVVPGLIRWIQDPATDNRTRDAAICILGDFHQQPEVVVPLLLKILEDPDNPSRRSAALHLEYFSSEAKTVVPVLTRLLNDDDPKMREIAESSLNKIKAATTNKVMR